MSKQRRNALCVGLAMILGLLGCGVLYGPLIGPNPNHCANNPSICTESQQCNTQTGFCVDAALDLATGGLDTPTPDMSSKPTGWAWQNPLPQGNTLTAVHGTDANNVWAVGYAGTIVKAI